MLITDGAILGKSWHEKQTNSKIVLYAAISTATVVILLSIGVFIGYQLASGKSNLQEFTTSEIRSMKPQPSKLYRLSRDVVPTGYTLHLDFASLWSTNYSTINQDEYQGTVKIHLNVIKSTNQIQLHSSDEIQIMNVTVSNQEMVQTLDNGISLISNYPNQLTILLPHELERGYISTLHIEFRANVSKNIYGIFYGHKPENESISKSVVNIFQAENARLGFPCLDEIDLKVPWDIVLDHPVNTTALSNQMAVRSAKLNENVLRTEFARTKPMSTYLVSIAVLSNYSKMCRTTESGIEICIWYSNFSEDLLLQFIHTTELIFRLCEKILGTKYDYEKYDILIVDRYLSGGFEGWGLTTLRRDVLTIWKNNLIVHECIHQWIGNQVTAADWGDVWLNEGITTYLTAIIENMNITENGSFVYDTTGLEQRSLFLNKYYGLENVFNAMYGSVFSPVPGSLTGEYKLSTVVYGKPASILFMLEGLIGRAKLWTVIKNLVMENMYSVINTDDFLDALERETRGHEYGVNIEQFMESWLYRIGLPILKVESFNITHCSITQVALPDTTFHNVTSNTWPIPLWYQVNGGNTELKWILEKRVFHPYGSPDDIVVFNPRFQGYYHVLVEDKLVSKKKKIESEDSKYMQMLSAERKVICEELKRMPDVEKFC